MIAKVGRMLRGVALAASVASVTDGCTKASLVGTSSVKVIVDSLVGADGATPERLQGTVPSDVLTFVTDASGNRVATVFADPGQATLSLALKDPGTPASPTAPTTANFVTLTRYRVEYLRTDGRNRPGIDVPYPFDGAVTVTVGGAPVQAGFTLVRAQAKQEGPLMALAGVAPCTPETAGSVPCGAGVISTIARVTFYGADETGRLVSVIGQIGIDFADWGDPQ